MLTHGLVPISTGRNCRNLQINTRFHYLQTTALQFAAVLYHRRLLGHGVSTSISRLSQELITAFTSRANPIVCVLYLPVLN
jgi:hypothetical protein